MPSEFGSRRIIDVITPDSFIKPMKVISTVFSVVGKGGETAIACADSLNSTTIDFRNLDYCVLKKHTKETQARKFHKRVTDMIAKDFYFTDKEHFLSGVKKAVYEWDKN